MAIVKQQAGGLVSSESWPRLAVGEAVPASGPVLVPLETWATQHNTLARRGDIGLWLAPATDLTTVPSFDGLSAIAIDFPAYGDGRGYSLARLVRERHGWRGELWAIGDVLIDQISLMLRVGFSGFEPKKGVDLAAFERAIARFQHVYQVAADGRPSAARQRHAQ